MTDTITTGSPNTPTTNEASHGAVWRVAGPVVVAKGLRDARLYNVVFVGEERLPGEVIRLDGDRVTIQVYEETSGIRVGEPVEDTGAPLQAVPYTHLTLPTIYSV